MLLISVLFGGAAVWSFVSPGYYYVARSLLIAGLGAYLMYRSLSVVAPKYRRLGTWVFVWLVLTGFLVGAIQVGGSGGTGVLGLALVVAFIWVSAITIAVALSTWRRTDRAEK